MSAGESKLKDEEPLRLKITVGSVVYSVACSPDGSRIVSGSDDGTVRVWDAVSGECVLGPLEGHTGDVNSVSFSGEGSRIVSGSRDKIVRVWDAAGNCTHILKGHMSWVSSVSFSGDKIASGSGDKTVRVWDAAGNCLHVLEGHTKEVSSVSFSGDKIASGSWDNTVRVWDAVSGVCVLGPLEGHNGWVSSVSFSGNKIASGSVDKTVRVWNAVSGALLKTLEGHKGWVSSVSFSGNKIASGSVDKTVRVWDAVSGECVLGPLKRHTMAVNSVSFSGDGSRIVSGSQDKTMRVWEPWQPDLIAFLRIPDIIPVTNQATGKTYNVLQVVNFNQYVTPLLSFKKTLLNLKHIKEEGGTLTGMTPLGKKYVKALKYAVKSKEKKQVPAAKRVEEFRKLRF